MKGHHFLQRLGFAWQGLTAAWRLEKSLRTHALATLGVLLVAAWVQAPALWWAALCLSIGMVVATELLNTALEALADHLHPDQHPAIKYVKDVAAGAVLIASLVALGVGIAFFWDQVLPHWQAT